MPALTVTPNPAAPLTVVAVAGTGFDNARTRLLLDGVGSSTNVFRPRKDGTFNVGITVGSTPKTQTLVAEQLGSTWSEKARVAVTVQAPATVPGLTFEDNFADLSKWVMGEWLTTGLSSESDNMGDLRQCSIVDGMLRIRCERGTTPSGRPWRSGVLATKGKFSQRYGNFQARMKYPTGQGLWPAFWLLDATSEGRRPELDIVEAYPNTGPWSATQPEPYPGVKKFIATNHWRDASGAMQQTGQTIDTGIDLTADFHVWELDWRPGVLSWRLDGVEKHRQTANVPTMPMFLILDMVVGGWAGASDASTPDPADLLVDWVRVAS